MFIKTKITPGIRGFVELYNKVQDLLKVIGEQFITSDKALVSTLIINVLKTGSDRPVRPVEPSTGHKTGSVQSKNHFFIKSALNRSNRRSDR